VIVGEVVAGGEVIFIAVPPPVFIPRKKKFVDGSLLTIVLKYR